MTERLNHASQEPYSTEYRPGSSMTRQPWGEQPVVRYTQEEIDQSMELIGLDPSGKKNNGERSDGEGS